MARSDCSKEQIQSRRDDRLLGFEQAGFDIAAAIEIDPIHCVTHEYNFPETATICASVANLTGDKIRALANLGDRDIDVVMGGAPCQGFSLMGKRQLDDPRNLLVAEYVRLVGELAPKYCVFENVKGLTIGAHRQFLDDLIEQLDSIGYAVRLPYQVLNAAEYGVPQNRHRLFLLAARKGLELSWYPEPFATKVTVRQAIEDLPDIDKIPELATDDCVRLHKDYRTYHTYAAHLHDEYQYHTYAYRRKYDIFQLTCSGRTIHNIDSISRFAATLPGKTEPVSHFHRLDWDKQCNTLRAGTDSARGAHTAPRPIHPQYPRLISVREAARLHSYPDWFRFHSTKWHGFRQIGNSVPPLLAYAVATQLIKAMGLVPVKPPITRFFELRGVDPSDDRDKLLKWDMKTAAAYFEVPIDTIRPRIKDGSKQPR